MSVQLRKPAPGNVVEITGDNVLAIVRDRLSAFYVVEHLADDTLALVTPNRITCPPGITWANLR